MSESFAAAQPLPYLTPEFSGVGGAIKRYDEDFVVEELPLYEPCGEGTHVYFTIEKRGLTTLDAVRLFAKHLGRRRQDIGYAGLKDAHGVTRQTLSIEHADPEHVRSLPINRIRVLHVTRHTNKIKLGHLAGNRFEIRIRGTRQSPLEPARCVLDVLVRRGVPNFFGPQRFGVRGDNAAVGLAVLREDYDAAIAQILGRPAETDHGPIRRARELYDQGDLAAAAAAWPGRRFAPQTRLCRALLQSGGDTHKAWRSVDHTLRRLYLSAVQSDLFNRLLAARIAGLDCLQTGDLAWIHRNGACFRVEDAAREQPRCDTFEISPSGPLFGRKMKEPDGAPAELESRVLAEAGLSTAHFRCGPAARLDGARRPLRVPLSEAASDAGRDEHGPFLQMAFRLPPGAYATNVTREICKTDLPHANQAGE